MKLDVLIFCSERSFLSRVSAIVESGGHHVAGTARMGEELKRRWFGVKPDVVLAHGGRRLETRLKAMKLLHSRRGLPVVLVCHRMDGVIAERAAQAGVVSILQESVNRDGLLCALEAAALFSMREQWLKGRIGEQMRHLDERKLVGKAQGFLMDTMNLSHESALDHLRRKVRREAKPLVDVAREILTNAT